MQPSGQAWAQVLQPVQRSSNQRRLVRARAGKGRTSSGNCTVTGGLKKCLRVTRKPLIRPMPYKRESSEADSTSGADYGKHTARRAMRTGALNFIAGEV